MNSDKIKRIQFDCSHDEKDHVKTANLPNKAEFDHVHCSDINDQLPHKKHDNLTPLTGNTHILMRYEPKLEKRPNISYVHMDKMKFYHDNHKIHINQEHY